MSDYLPVEVLIDILTRLPVETLIRCTSVCKSWYSLITSTSFITTHLNRTISNNGSQILVRSFITRPHSFYGTEHYSVLRDNQAFDKLATLDFPFTCIEGYFRIIGSFNGLVCLSDDAFGYKDIMYLWNPSIRKFVTIPIPRVTFKSHGPFAHTIGFSFDAKTNDYKIVRVVYVQYNDDIRAPPEVELYELSTGSWRSINPGDFKYVADERAPQAFLNGVVHWTGFKRDFPRVIVTFDMKKEELGALMMPPSLERALILRVAVAVFLDSLSLIDVVFGDENYCCIWVMEVYGVEKSWTKKFNIDIRNGDLRATFAVSENGGVIFSKRNYGYGYGIGDLVCYDPKSKQIKNLGVCGCSEAFYTDSYVESLVLVKGLSDAGACEEAESKEDGDGKSEQKE